MGYMRVYEGKLKLGGELVLGSWRVFRDRSYCLGGNEAFDTATNLIFSAPDGHLDWIFHICCFWFQDVFKLFDFVCVLCSVLWGRDYWQHRKVEITICLFQMTNHLRY